jgi:hypothetical protein
LAFLSSPFLLGPCEIKFASPWGYFINSQERRFKSVLAVFMSLVVYENLLFFTITIQASGQNKIHKQQQKFISFG